MEDSEPLIFLLILSHKFHHKTLSLLLWGYLTSYYMLLHSDYYIKFIYIFNFISKIYIYALDLLKQQPPLKHLLASRKLKTNPSVFLNHLHHISSSGKVYFSQSGTGSTSFPQLIHYRVCFFFGSSGWFVVWLLFCDHRKHEFMFFHDEVGLSLIVLRKFVAF